jgi:hypothetical protein
MSVAARVEVRDRHSSRRYPRSENTESRSLESGRTLFFLGGCRVTSVLGRRVLCLGSDVCHCVAPYFHSFTHHGSRLHPQQVAVVRSRAEGAMDPLDVESWWSPRGRREGGE